VLRTGSYSEDEVLADIRELSARRQKSFETRPRFSGESHYSKAQNGVPQNATRGPLPLQGGGATSGGSKAIAMLTARAMTWLKPIPCSLHGTNWDKRPANGTANLCARSRRHCGVRDSEFISRSRSDRNRSDTHEPPPTTQQPFAGLLTGACNESHIVSRSTPSHGLKWTGTSGESHLMNSAPGRVVRSDALNPDAFSSRQLAPFVERAPEPCYRRVSRM
jgi:hypothetical protein